MNSNLKVTEFESSMNSNLKHFLNDPAKPTFQSPAKYEGPTKLHVKAKIKNNVVFAAVFSRTEVKEIFLNI